jgi:predicted O-methyltransferase YrrM
MTQEQKYYFEEFYQKSCNHQVEHKCGGNPYREYDKLFGYVSKFQPLNVLEIGTAIGFTASVIKNANPNCSLDTMDLDSNHLELAKSNLAQFDKITFLVGEAKNLLPQIKSNTYDLIFFDGYSPQYKFLVEFERLLKNKGLLVTANSHLKGPAGSTKEQYIESLQNKNKWTLLEEFDDTKVIQKIF